MVALLAILAPIYKPLLAGIAAIIGVVVVYFTGRNRQASTDATKEATTQAQSIVEAQTKSNELQSNMDTASANAPKTVQEFISEAQKGDL